ncbi:flavin reductase family protein [Pseudonocardia kujensis]|uniref:flavin reductase family protein n=1 Tax=Pseudonocardia kujensis TaxID=1128675 RepID=UPI001E604200|nr:flavin reductase family protein [Pseudonocardia kujensis]MCE0762031.1 flavin reductase family protein [Pseudonocardia kujensis]
MTSNGFGKGVHALAPALPGSAEVRTVFGRYAAAVGALCAVVDGRPIGLVATSLAVGASFDPPMITFSCRKESTTWPMLRTAPRIGVSVLGQGQAAVCTRIAGPAADRFRGLDLYETAEGALFVKYAMTWLDCRISAEMEVGDHAVVVLELIEVGHDLATEPLIFLDGEFPALRRRSTAV